MMNVILLYGSLIKKTLNILLIYLITMLCMNYEHDVTFMINELVDSTIFLYG